MSNSFPVLSSYPKVLFDYAISNNRINTVFKQSNFLISLLENEDNLLLNFLKNLKVSKHTRKDFVDDVFGKKLDKEFLYLLKTIIDFNRCSLLLPIMYNFQKLCNGKLRILSVEVHSAFPLAPLQLKKIEKAMINKYKSKIYIKSIVDQNLIGGIKIITPLESIDDSFQNKISLIKKSAYRSLIGVNLVETGEQHVNK